MKLFKIIIGFLLLIAALVTFISFPIIWMDDWGTIIGNILSKVIVLYLGYKLVRSGFGK